MHLPHGKAPAERGTHPHTPVRSAQGHPSRRACTTNFQTRDSYENGYFSVTLITSDGDRCDVVVGQLNCHSRTAYSDPLPTWVLCPLVVR